MSKKRRRLWDGNPAPPEGQLPRGLVVQQEIQASAFSGPLPPPEAMAQYEAILPGFTDRVLTNFEKQSAHRMELEKGAISHERKMGSRGQIFGLTVALVGLLLGGLLVWSGREIYGTILATGDLVALVGLFIYGKESSKRELKRKTQQIPATQQKLARH